MLPSTGIRLMIQCLVLALIIVKQIVAVNVLKWLPRENVVNQRSILSVNRHVLVELVLTLHVRTPKANAPNMLPKKDAVKRKFMPSVNLHAHVETLNIWGVTTKTKYFCSL